MTIAKKRGMVWILLSFAALFLSSCLTTTDLQLEKRPLVKSRTLEKDTVSFLLINKMWGDASLHPLPLEILAKTTEDIANSCLPGKSINVKAINMDIIWEAEAIDRNDGGNDGFVFYVFFDTEDNVNRYNNEYRIVTSIYAKDASANELIGWDGDKKTLGSYSTIVDGEVTASREGSSFNQAIMGLMDEYPRLLKAILPETN